MSEDAESPTAIVQETRTTIEMLRLLTRQLEWYNNLLEAELDRQIPLPRGDEDGE